MTDTNVHDTPSATGGILNVDVAAGAAIAETKLSLASDAAAATASRRTLGTGATQAAAGSHAHATLYEPLITTLWIPGQNLELGNGAAMYNGAGHGAPGWLLDATAIEYVSSIVALPPGWATYNCALYWSNFGAGTGDVTWRLAVKNHIDGAAMAATAAVVTLAITAPVMDVLKISTLASGVAAPAAGGAYVLQIQRRGNDAGDTLANDCALFGVLLTKAS